MGFLLKSDLTHLQNDPGHVDQRITLSKERLSNIIFGEVPLFQQAHLMEWEINKPYDAFYIIMEKDTLALEVGFRILKSKYLLIFETYEAKESIVN